MKTIKKISKKDIVKEISKMPFYQVHYTKKMILKLLNNNEIPETVIVKAIETIKI